MNAWTRFQETFRTAVASIWAHRMRSMLTTLGIIIGVGSVIAVVNLTKGLEGRIMSDVKQEGTHTFFVSAWVPYSRFKTAKIRRMPMDAQTIRELRELMPAIRVASPQSNIFSPQMVVKAGSVTRRVTYLTCVDENGLDLSNRELACGRNFTATDRTTRAPLAILGATIAEDLGLGEHSVGKHITVSGQTVELVGILKKHGEIPFMPSEGEDEDSAMWGPDGMFFVPFGSLRELARPGAFDSPFWRLQVDARVPVKEAENTLRQGLRRIRGLRGDDADNFMLESNEKAVAQVEKIGKTLMTASGAMVGISLLVGGIGVMNIMLVSVTERTREIGVRKALGARRRNILFQFLIEATLLCVAGGVIGTALGMVLGTVLSQVLMKHLGGVPAWAFLSALLVPAAVGMGFGLYPANKAAKLDPIEALRYE
ncbi:ABC transporter permease [Mesoterricola silvestris]|uniref:ABC transporter permease n=1 Tax=Mesoterricola silvestris TaxID=2927979 RepID=A0AA48K9C5_9BACT|nr:ABC transporter permease [Mesoterricola silvestris]BDU72187.1 ABC transporter permease [Mesoterricola silvestris]